MAPGCVTHEVLGQVDPLNRLIPLRDFKRSLFTDEEIAQLAAWQLAQHEAYEPAPDQPFGDELLPPAASNTT